MIDPRANPDRLLERLVAEQTKTNRGRLKVFLGASPGVGKTFAMLQAAQQKRSKGREVVAGLIETHGRAETEALLQGLEVLPRRVVAYRGRGFAEFDLDAALGRKPTLLLVDELAHTNVPGARHPKRWQDVAELVQAGIEVWTTLNIQHLESLNDIVAQITGVRVRETLPDAVLEGADELELVDLAPEALLQRLREGKVYGADRAERAAIHFFQRGNLLALRELALRRMAERVDADVQAHRRDEGIEANWQVAEHIAVCVGPAPNSADLIRAAKRMAVGLRARWTAVSVEVAHTASSHSDRQRLNAHFRLAEQLGAQVVPLVGLRVSDELLAWCRTHNVTRIVLGKPTHPRWRDLIHGSLLSEVVRGSGDIEVHAISGLPLGMAPPPDPAPIEVLWSEYLGAAAAVVGTTLLAWLLQHIVAPSELAMVYLVGIMLAAMRFGRWPSVLAAALSVAAYDFCFVDPRFAFSVADSHYWLTFAVMFGLGVVISTLTGQVRAQASHARAREQRTAALYALSRGLGAAGTAEKIVAMTQRHVASLFCAQMQVFPESMLADGLARPPQGTAPQPDERELSPALCLPLTCALRLP